MIWLCIHTWRSVVLNRDTLICRNIPVKRNTPIWMHIAHTRQHGSDPNWCCTQFRLRGITLQTPTLLSQLRCFGASANIQLRFDGVFLFGYSWWASTAEHINSSLGQPVWSILDLHSKVGNCSSFDLRTEPWKPPHMRSLRTSVIATTFEQLGAASSLTVRLHSTYPGLRGARNL